MVTKNVNKEYLYQYHKKGALIQTITYFSRIHSDSLDLLFKNIN